MHHTAVFLHLIVVMQAVSVFRKAAHRDAGLEHFHIDLNMLMGVLHS